MILEYDVSIIIVNYNGIRYIDALLEGLSSLHCTDFSFEVVFVDNCSTDGSVKYFYEQAGRYDFDTNVIESEENLGFAGGNNLGVKNAKGKYIVLLNNDTKPNCDWLDNLYHFITSHDDVVMANSKMIFFYDFLKLSFETKDKIHIKRNVSISGKDYRIDAKLCKNVILEDDEITCFGHSQVYVPIMLFAEDFVLDFDTLRCSSDDSIMIAGEKHLLSIGPSNIVIDKQCVENFRKTLVQNAGSGINADYDGFDIGFCEEDNQRYCCDYEIENGCGAGIIFRKSDFDKVGGFDERFFMYYEDTDLSFRMKKMTNKKIMYCHNAVVRHVHAGSSGEWSPFFTYHVFRNKLFFLKNNIGYLIFLKYFFKQLIQGIRHRDKAKIKGTLDAF